MKKILLLLMISMLSLTTFGQLGLGFGMTKGGALSPYCAEADALFARMPMQPDNDRKILYNNMIKSLKAGGFYDDLDVLVLMVNQDSTEMMNIIQNKYNPVLAGNGRFVTDGGFFPKVSVPYGYIKSSFVPTTAVADGSKFQKESASFGYYTPTNSSSSLDEFGAYGTNGANILINPMFNSSGSKCYVFVNNDYSAPYYQATTKSNGFWVATRTSGNAMVLYNDSAVKISAARVAPGVPDREIYVSNHNNGSVLQPAGRTIWCYFIGRYLSEAKVQALEGILKTYFDGVAASHVGKLQILRYVYNAPETELYVRSQYNSVNSIVFRQNNWSQNRSIVPYYWTMTLPVGTLLTKANMDAYQTLIHGASDDSPPFYTANYAQLAGGHTNNSIFRLTLNHTKTVADLGSVYTYGGNDYYLLSVTGTTATEWVCKKKLVDGIWVVPSAPAVDGNLVTMTWKNDTENPNAGAKDHSTITNGVVSAWYAPSTFNWVIKQYFNGVEFTPRLNKLYYVNTFATLNSYDVVDPATHKFLVNGSGAYSNTDTLMSRKDSIVYSDWGGIIITENQTLRSGKLINNFEYYGTFNTMWSTALPNINNVYIPKVKMMNDPAAPQAITYTTGTGVSPIKVKIAAHGMTTPQQVTITGVVGNTAANGTFYVTKVSTDTISLNGSTGNGDYVSGGSCQVVWDYKNIVEAQNTTGYPRPSQSLRYKATDWLSSINPPDRQVDLWQTSVGGGRATRTYGFAFGFIFDDPTSSVYSRTRADTLSINPLSFAEDLLSVKDRLMIDNLRTITGPRTWKWTAYKRFFDSQAYPNTTSCYWVKTGAYTYFYIDYHQSVTDDLIHLPSMYDGKTIINVETGGTISITSGATIPATGITLTTTDYGYVVFKVLN